MIRDNEEIDLEPCEFIYQKGFRIYNDDLDTHVVDSGLHVRKKNKGFHISGRYEHIEDYYELKYPANEQG